MTDTWEAEALVALSPLFCFLCLRDGKEGMEDQTTFTVKRGLVSHFCYT